jgi:hypothetical protein
MTQQSQSVTTHATEGKIRVLQAAQVQNNAELATILDHRYPILLQVADFKNLFVDGVRRFDSASTATVG